MRFSTLLLSLVLFFVSCETEHRQVQDKDKNTSKPQVGILGVFHFAGTSDFSSVEFESLKSEKRQKEIIEIVERLKAFKPNKIMLEFPMAQSDYLDSMYTASLNGEGEYSINEIEQLGFRLAKRLNHKRIYSIDYKLSLPFGELTEFAEKNDKKRFDKMLSSIKEQDRKESDFLANNSLIDYLIFRNSEAEDIRNKDQYLNQTAKFVGDSSDVGAKFVSKWWERNIHMMTNIDRNMQPEDRILVIVGAAHRAVLKDFYEDRTDVDYVEIRTFLEKKSADN